jgi:hypothetical protein
LRGLIDSDMLIPAIASYVLITGAAVQYFTTRIRCRQWKMDAGSHGGKYQLPIVDQRQKLCAHKPSTKGLLQLLVE